MEDDSVRETFKMQHAASKEPLEEQTRFVKVYRMLSDVLKPCIIFFLNGKIIPYRSLVEFIRARNLVPNNRNIPNSVESVEDLDISALFAIATDGDILKPTEKRDFLCNAPVPGNLILWITEYWENILYMKINENTSFNEQQFENYVADFLKIADHFEQLTSQESRYTKAIKSIKEENMGFVKFSAKLIEYHTVCSRLLSPLKCEGNDTSADLKEHAKDQKDKVRFAKSYSILMSVIRPAICTLYERKLQQNGITLKQYIQSQKTLCNQSCFKTRNSFIESTSDLDITALNAISRGSNLIKLQQERRLIWDVTSIRNNLVHSPQPELTENEYKRYFSEFIGIANIFEKWNMEYGKYVTEVESIDRKAFDEKEVQTVVTTYHKYCVKIVSWMVTEKNIATEQEEALKKQIQLLKSEVNRLKVRGTEQHKEKYRTSHEMDNPNYKDKYAKEYVDKAENMAQTALGAVGGVVGVVKNFFSSKH